MQEAIEKASTLIEALEWIRRFRDKITVIKLGGAQMRIDDWEPAYHMNQCESPYSSEQFLELLYPYYAHCIDAFGVERCMFERSFPIL